MDDNQVPHSDKITDPTGPQKSSTALIVVILIIIVAIAVFAFANSNDEKSDTKNSVTNEESVQDDAMMEKNELEQEGDEVMIKADQILNVSGQNFSFSPNQLTVKKGETVKIVFNSTGGFHDFVIDEFDVSSDEINSGDTTEVTFVADKSGSFEYYCSIGNHREMGMVGTLVVEE